MIPYPLRRITRKIKSCFRRTRHERVIDYFPSGTRPKGHVLVSYIAESLLLGENDKRFLRHSNAWESAEIARLFNKHGYAVDAISWDDTAFIPEREYVTVFDIYTNLKRCSGPGTHKFFHATGSDSSFCNGAELKRISDLKMRRGAVVVPRRSVKAADVELSYGNLMAADTITLIGNGVTAATFPDNLQHKLNRVVPTGSHLSATRDSRKITLRKEFVWFNGTGAVHKGLDLTLEVFARNPGLVLHVVGPYLKESDFVEAYKHELTKCPNIISHGFLSPSSRKFQDITRHAVGFVSPSCSEGISTSAITCMQYGMVPILSVNSGIDLTGEMGYLLKSCAIEEIEAVVLDVIDRPEREIREMIACSQEYALKRFSREEFSRIMENHVVRALPS